MGMFIVTEVLTWEVEAETGAEAKQRVKSMGGRLKVIDQRCIDVISAADLIGKKIVVGTHVVPRD